MRNKIILTLLLLSSSALIYFGIDLFIQKKNIIQSGIGLSAGLLLSITFFLLWSTKTASRIIKNTSSVLGITLVILILLSYNDPALIPKNWNLIFALIILLSGISLIGKLNTKNKLTLFLIGALIILLEIILLFKIEDTYFFFASITLLIAASLLSLLAVFSKQ